MRREITARSTNVKSACSIPCRQRTNIVSRQVACADVILLNKTDLIDQPTLTTVKSTIQALNPTLRIHETIQSRLPLSELFNIRAFSADSTTLHTDDEHGDHTHEQGETHHSGISTVLIPLPRLDEGQFARLNTFIEGLLWKSELPNGVAAPEILRTKGYIKMKDGREYVLQGVEDLFELKEIQQSDGKGSGTGKIVFIGRDVGQRLEGVLLDHIGLTSQA
jgi:G3E family GTPase